MSLSQSNKDIINYGIIKNLIETTKRIQYGTILIQVHDSKVVQIEVTEKTRFDDWFVEQEGDI